MSEPKKEYDLQAKSRAYTHAALRACVSLYLVYMGVKLIGGAGAEGTTMSPALAWVFGIIMIGLAAAFAVFIWLECKKEIAAAELKPEEAKDAENAENAQEAETEENVAAPEKTAEPGETEE